MQSPTNHLLLECLPTAPGGGIPPCPGDTAPQAYIAAVAPGASAEELAAYGHVNYSESGTFFTIAFVAVVSTWATQLVFTVAKRLIK